MANIGATFSMIAISVIFIVAIIAVFQIQSFQSHYNSAFKDIVDQLNESQQREIDFDRRSKERVNTVVNDASTFNSSFVTNDAVAKGVSSQALNVYGTLKADKNSVQANDIVFSSRWSGYPNQDPNQAFISNDTELNKKLMIVGNKSDGSGERKVGVWDKLDVHGNLGIDKISSAYSVIAKERVGGEGVYMDKDGNIYSSTLIEGESIQGRDSISVGNGAAYMRKDGNVYANKNLVSQSTIDGQNIVGKNMVKVSNDSAWMKNDGTFSGRQVCLGGTCINKTELQKIKDMSSPSDCQMSSWTPWSLCSKPCGTGNQYRIRNVTKAAANGGKGCEELIQSQQCNKQACGVDCVVSNWSAWSSCSRTCGGGSRSRTRTVVSQPQNGGLACPELIQYDVCNTDACTGPQPCLLSDWSDFGACTKTCGGGTRTRTRYVLQPPMNGGTACDVTTQNLPCNTDPCPQDCVLGDWGPWSVCDKLCGPSSRTRTRAIATPAGPGGVACPTEAQRTETQQCNLPACDTMFNPVMWFKIQDVGIETTPNGSIIQRWTSSYINPNNSTPKVANGTGVGGSLGPIFYKNEVLPFIRLGGGMASTTVGDYFDCSTQTFNIGTNGGFTFVGKIRLYGPVANNERIFDFGSSPATNNIILNRNTTTNNWATSHWNVTTTNTDIKRTTTETFTSNTWMIVAIRVSNTELSVIDLTSTNTLRKFTMNPTTPNPILANRTFATTFLGKSSTATDSYANLDIMEMAFYDKYLSDTDLTTVMNTINYSCLSVFCSRTPYYLMNNEYFLGVLNNVHIVSAPSIYTFDFTNTRWNLIRVQLFGAGGGFSNGGDGAYIEGVLDINKLPSRRFFIVVGGAGSSTVTAINSINYTSAAFNGGGRGVAINVQSTLVGGGGGSTDLRLNYTSGSETDYANANRILVAGGGGGGAQNASATTGLVFAAGYPKGVDITNGAFGGTQTANGSFPATGRSQGLGGENTNVTSSMTSGNGGGGGGWYGGGAHPGTGTGGAGAGGSSFVNPLYFASQMINNVLTPTIKYGPGPNGTLGGTTYNTSITAVSQTQATGGGSTAGRDGRAILTFMS